MKYKERIKLVRSQNKLQLAANGGSMICAANAGAFITTIFEGKDGVYHDAVGDEIFLAIRIGKNDIGPVYKLVFEDDIRVGNLKDHGFNEYLGAL
jgi:hypothetical protein